MARDPHCLCTDGASDSIMVMIPVGWLLGDTDVSHPQRESPQSMVPEPQAATLRTHPGEDLESEEHGVLTLGLWHFPQQADLGQVTFLHWVSASFSMKWGQASTQLFAELSRALLCLAYGRCSGNAQQLSEQMEVTGVEALPSGK